MPVGTRTGAETTTLTAANLPSHAHAAPCPGDFGAAGGITAQDNRYDNNDFIAFINLFFNHNLLADIGRAGGVPGSDGSLDNNDFIEFINRFFVPC
ncbi:MAG: GC-type dockerin domain-anchored protein [Phycisphaerales bacterium]